MVRCAALPCRRIQQRVKGICNHSMLRQSMRLLAEWASMSRMVNTAAVVKMFQRRSLAMIPLYAWTGDRVHMWFLLTWHNWRTYTLNRCVLAGGGVCGVRACACIRMLVRMCVCACMCVQVPPHSLFGVHAHISISVSATSSGALNPKP